MSNPQDTEREHDRARQCLIEEIAREARGTAHWTGRTSFSPLVMAAMSTVPRHRFVLPAQQRVAYENRPLAIGHGQTISQPYIVAVMTDLLDLLPATRVLEIGTGCGYQTAILAEIAAHVYSIEVIAELATTAAIRLRDLGYGNVEVRHGDGWQGWPEAAPFDAIIVTAAALDWPAPLIEQLAPGGRLVIPIGPPGGTQWLYRGLKHEDGTLHRDQILPVAFVPMTGGHQ